MKLFNKKVSLIDKDPDHFIIQINEKRVEFNKKDIRKIRLAEYSGKASLISAGRLTLKMENETLRFSTDKHLNYLSSMEQHINEWRLGF